MSVKESPSLEGTGLSLALCAFGFGAGFSAVMVFHQGTLTLLNTLGIAALKPFPMQPTWPFGVPQVWSLAFWGGVWGIAFAAVERWFPRGWMYWVSALLFGALGPTLVAWFVVFPLKGLSVAAGWHAPRMVTGLLINGAWGLGVALQFWAQQKGPLADQRR
jgi:hypothetical protein